MEKSETTGADFEFLITPADIEIKAEDFDSIMTPSSMPWTKVEKDGWCFYNAREDEFAYS